MSVASVDARVFCVQRLPDIPLSDLRIHRYTERNRAGPLMRCAYDRLPDGRYRCLICGDETSRAPEQPPVRQCVKETASIMWDHSKLVAKALASNGDGAASLGLGDIVAAGLDSVGITKDRVAKWWGAPCNCKDRQERLNKLGQAIVAFARGGADQ